jgi:hypothetical protein
LFGGSVYIENVGTKVALTTPGMEARRFKRAYTRPATNAAA